MSLQDPIADMLTRIRNAQMASLKTATMPSSKQKKAICEVLLNEGFITSYNIAEGVKPELTVELKYLEDGTPVIDMLKRTSRPGLRIYATVDKLPRVNAGLGVAIVSTSQGVMTGKAAKRRGIGGEVLCTVF
ncbi:MAG: 30S ribosomal protein S8 [Gammaproteobacteria bacterium]|nr:30S ribosomal protein S8 [Gammaproteobacteria bacterium]